MASPLPAECVQRRPIGSVTLLIATGEGELQSCGRPWAMRGSIDNPRSGIYQPRLAVGRITGVHNLSTIGRQTFFTDRQQLFMRKD